MGDPRCWREVLLRGGIMLIIAAITYFLLDAGAWVWLIPTATVVLVLLKWLVRPKSLDEQEGWSESEEKE